MNISYLLALLFCLLASFSRIHAQALVVNTTGDADDGACDALHCSLREAILAANQNPGPDTITFAIPGPFPFVISPASPLPALTDAGAVIDAVTQPGGNTTGVITIDGVNAGAGANGFEINAPACAILGFSIRRFANGIRISAGNARIGAGNVIGSNSNAGIILTAGANNAVIYGNFIGTDAGGIQAEPNGHGIWVNGPVSNLTVGGPAPGQYNLIAGNTGEGIWAQSINGITIRSNLIGFAPFAPGLTLPNGANGIRIENSVNAVIGDMADPNAGNYIIGNSLHGVYLSSIPAGVRVEGNTIGALANNLPTGNGANGILAISIPGAQFTGNQIHANGAHGLEVRATEGLLIRDNYIGYFSLADRATGNAGNGILLANCSNFAVEDNTASGNGEHGIAVEMSPGIAPADGIITGNNTGVFDAGVASTGNAGFGIRVANAYNLLIGAPGQGNTVGGNGEGGIHLSNSLDLIIQGNVVGTDASFSLDFGNGGPGILIDSLSEGILLGGLNAIAYNQGPGVQVTGEALSCTITRNSIFCNAGGGIQVDTGANDDVTPPGEICAGPDRVSGISEPFAVIELFRHSQQDCAAPPCQGRVFLASVIADFDGRWAIDGPFAQGDTLTATATNLLGSTSEFSHCAETIELPIALASNPGPVCAGEEVQLLGAVQPPASDVVFEWTGPDGFSSDQPNPAGNLAAGEYVLTVSRGFCRAVPDTTEVTILPLASGRLEATLCHGASVTVNGVVYDAANPAGTEVLSGAAANGCDSVVSVSLDFFPPAEGQIQTTLCAGLSLTVNGTVYDAGNPAGTEVLAGAAANGCDSVVNVNLGFFPPAEGSIQTTLCAGRSLTVNGTVYDDANPSGTEILPGAAANGCDSTVLVNLSFFPPAQSLLEHGICPDEFVVVNGQVYDRNRPAGLEVISGGSVQGCDSVVTVNLFLLEAPESIFEMTICPGASITINGTTYGENRRTGTETLPGAAVNGCDSVIQVRIEVDSLILTGIPRDTVWRIRKGQTVQLGLGFSFVPGRINWSPVAGLSCSDCPDPLATPASSVIYTAVIEHAGCTALHTVQIEVDDRVQWFAPNAFSPNDDGINDRFTIFTDVEEAPRIVLMRIFDRWGGVVFERKDMVPGDESSGWDGKTRGKPCNSGVYMFVAEVETAFGEVLRFNGDFLLLR